MLGTRSFGYAMTPAPCPSSYSPMGSTWWGCPCSGVLVVPWPHKGSSIVLAEESCVSVPCLPQENGILSH